MIAIGGHRGVGLGEEWDEDEGVIGFGDCQEINCTIAGMMTSRKRDDSSASCEIVSREMLCRDTPSRVPHLVVHPAIDSTAVELRLASMTKQPFSNHQNSGE